jgi:transcriptional regulator with XRE-family HTH domain
LSALDLRRSGLSYAQVAAKLGIAESTASELVQRALQGVVQEPGADVIKLELQRLDAALAAIWARVVKGEVEVIDRLLKIQERRAKLEGLDKAMNNVLPPVEPGPDISKLSPSEMRTHFELLAKAARTDAERVRYEAAAASLLPRDGSEPV